MDDLPEWDTPDMPSTTPLDARVMELVLMHASYDPRWVRTAMVFGRDVQDDDLVYELLASFCTLVSDVVMGGHVSRDVAIARLEGQLDHLRAQALEEAQT